MEIAALQTMLERLETQGSLSTQNNQQFIEELVAQMNAEQTLNGTFVINVPNTLTGQIETIEIKEQITLLQDQINNLPAAQVGAPVSTPNTNP